MGLWIIIAWSVEGYWFIIEAMKGPILVTGAVIGNCFVKKDMAGH